jgi:methylthioribose-1-phosphate isomerase
MVVRSAPAIGVTAAYGVALAALQTGAEMIRFSRRPDSGMCGY